MSHFEDRQLSKDFRLSELVASELAALHQIDNSPNAERISNLRALAVHLLQPLRDLLARPIVVSSGYRCPAVNKLAGGKEHSQHMANNQDAAVDTYCPGMSAKELYVFITDHKDQLNYDQCILEADRGVVHLSFKRGRQMDIRYRP